MLTALFWLSAFSQPGHESEPGFKTVYEDSISIKGYTLMAAYYPLKDNFKNKQPTIQQVTMVLTYGAADCIILSRKGEVIKSIMLLDYPRKQFLVMNPLDKNSGPLPTAFYPNPLQGDIGENRADELVKSGWDAAAKIETGKLTFNNKQYTIIPNSAIEQAVIQLIRSQHWADK
jgi:hypothetical protein